MKRYILPLTLVFALSFVSCEKEATEKPDEINTEALQTKSAKAIIASNNQFAFEFFKEVMSSEKEADNIMVSPVSLSMALGMLYNGTDGVTEEAFRNTLHYTENSSETNAFYRSLIDQLSSSENGSIMEIANSIWIRNGFPVKPEFIELNTQNFDSEVENRDFRDPKTLDDINGWVKEKTHDKIPKILEEISDEAVMYLINALYFNANWHYQFSEEHTQDKPFYTSESGFKEVPTMTMTEDLAFYKNDLFSSVVLPYEKEKFSMVLLLPNQGKSVDDIVASVDGDTWSTWMKSYDTTEVVLNLPKFKFDYKKLLNNDLKKMGLANMFTNQANFSKMTDANVLVSFVLQKTYVDVHEKGTEAAAVTIIGIEVTSLPINQKVYLNFDRPFLFAIKENSTGSICFIGKVGSPEYKD